MAALSIFFSLFALLVGNTYGQSTADFSQAQAMMELLRSCHENKVPEGAIEHVASLLGTRLVVQQQNISRRVTTQQYTDVLRAACVGKIANVKPAEPGARAQKGATGLIQDVGPSLVWGRDNVPLLESSLAKLLRNQSLGNAIPLVRKYLPEQVPLSPKFYVVMGGRAGAAAIDDQLYFDVLITAWRSSRGTAAAMTPTEVIEFFAHETHHLGYGRILDHKRGSLTLSPGEAQAWGFLVATMMEGSATLLINGHESLVDLERQPDIEPYLAKVPDLLPAMQNILRGALERPMPDESYAEALTPFFDMGYHAAGAVLLAAIEKKRGLAGVIEVMADPRQLLTAYDDCANESTATFRFDPALAQRVADIGQSQR